MTEKEFNEQYVIIKNESVVTGYDLSGKSYISSDVINFSVFSKEQRSADLALDAETPEAAIKEAMKEYHVVGGNE